MTGISITYELWPDAADPGWLLVQIQRQNTGECLSAFTPPSDSSKVLKLMERLESGKAEFTNIEFINYYRAETDVAAEINDDLNVVTLNGSLEQSSDDGVPNPRIQIAPDSVRALLIQMLRDRSFIDSKLFEFLGEISPDSFASFANSIDTGDSDSRTGLSESDSLSIDSAKREVFWKNRKLKINSHSEFEVLKTLHVAGETYVSYLDLLRAVKPNALQITVSKSLASLPPELKKPLHHVRDALRRVKAPLVIQNQRGHGFRLTKK